MGNRRKTEKLVFIALLVALSVVLSLIDRFLSSFFPSQGVRIGLANIVILTGLYYLNFKESCLLIILKTIISGFIMGNFMAFLIGLSGSVLSFIVMYLLLRFTKKVVSITGVSVAGSIAHNIGQVLVLIMYYGYAIIFNLIWLIPTGVVTGLFIGSVVSLVRVYLDKGQVFKTITIKKNDELERLIDGNGH